MRNNIPQPALILAGILAQKTVEHAILYYTPYDCYLPLVCKPCGLIWIPFLIFSVIMTFLSVVKTPAGHRCTRGVLTFLGSLILNMSAGLDTTVKGLACFTDYNRGSYDAFVYRIIVYAAILILVLAAVIVTLIFCLKRPGNSHLLDPDVILVGVCLQCAIEWVVYYALYDPFTLDLLERIWPWNRGTQCYGILAELVVLSFILAVIKISKSPSQKVCSGIFTLVCSFILNLCSGYRGDRVEVIYATCDVLNKSVLNKSAAELYILVSLAVTGLGALIATVIFLIRRDSVEQEGAQRVHCTSAANPEVYGGYNVYPNSAYPNSAYPQQ